MKIKREGDVRGASTIYSYEKCHMILLLHHRLLLLFVFFDSHSLSMASYASSPFANSPRAHLTIAALSQLPAPPAALSLSTALSFPPPLLLSKSCQFLRLTSAAARQDSSGLGRLGRLSFSKQDYESVDVAILSNGPGEVATWVKPVVRSLRRRFKNNLFTLRISVILAPCPHASGKEMELVQSFEEVDRCQGPERFWRVVLFGRSDKSWDWHKRGVCIFLGGDQFYAILFGRRFGYKTIVYAEERVRWPGLVDMYLLRSEELMEKVPKWAHGSCKVAGELLLDAVASSNNRRDGTINVCDKYCKLNAANVNKPFAIVGLLPGSKSTKLAIGVPYFMTVAEHMQARMGASLQFILPLAPTVSLSMLAKHADPDKNCFISHFDWAYGRVLIDSKVQNSTCLKGKCMGLLVTKGGVSIEIYLESPPYNIFKQCTLCLTTVGANTAELGYLGVPMIVVLPTHALEVFKGASGGVLGILANTTGWIGDTVAKVSNSALLKSVGFIAWPNRWAGKEVVPELVGKVEPQEVASLAAVHLESSDKLKSMHENLIRLRQKQQILLSEREGQLQTTETRDCGGGAADLVANTVEKLLLFTMN
ncbi:hypothetical protein O6H91_14G054600 [Diphasiastrum complanatum]|uniref:Uncharacterized protein n=1 Tax=Diphasiastrum complanatum TaxID=34168 RepID=A0ACC2BPG8_DIPCM|nr:hypothetical protein O6H91_14G054600 [Diphasiastrum complanatum]